MNIIEQPKCNNNGCNCTLEERESNNGKCKDVFEVYLPVSMNIIGQKSNNIINHFMAKGATVSKADYDFIRQSMLEVMETVLKEAELKPLTSEPCCIDEFVLGYKNATKDQKQRHKDIIQSYKQ